MDTAELYLGTTTQAPFRMPTIALSRHVVCLGTTGSGKTALCLALLEEAALQKIPLLALDPKGDVANLLLTFPDLSADQFEPWVSEDLVSQKGGRQRAASFEAARWRSGLEASGLSIDSIRKFRTSTNLTIYTPGSKIAHPIALLGSLRPPQSPEDLWGDLARSTALALLALAGIEVEVGRSREEALLVALFLHTWRDGNTIEVPDLLSKIQRPPMTQIGVLDLETYYPEKDRFALVIALNHLLATRANLLEGAPLDVDELLNNQGGQTRVSILSTAHLAEPERVAFTTALLGSLVHWLRRQPGRASPRALLFLDEATGYLPPVANPPTKNPLLTLLKQGRAQGFCVAVATQNPADLDYKALSNAGTWFVGRLATSRDRQRVKDALEESDLGLRRADVDTTLASLEPRQFLCQSFWTDPVIFQSRWTMSYLRGPLTTKELQRFSPSSSPRTTSPTLVVPPIVPPGVKQLFYPVAPGQHCEAWLLALVRLNFQDRRHAIESTEEQCLVFPIPTGSLTLDLSTAKHLDLSIKDLQEDPIVDSIYNRIPSRNLSKSSIQEWKRLLVTHLNQNEVRTWWWCEKTQMLSTSGEPEDAFRKRLAPTLAPLIEEEIEALHKAQSTKIQATEGRLSRAEQALERRKERASRTKTDTVLSAGVALLGGIFGGRGNVRSAVRVAQKATQSKHADNEVNRAEDSVEDCRDALTSLQKEFAQEEKTLRDRLHSAQIPLDRVDLYPAKTRIEIQYLGLVWLPPGVGLER